MLRLVLREAGGIDACKKVCNNKNACNKQIAWKNKSASHQFSETRPAPHQTLASTTRHASRQSLLNADAHRTKHLFKSQTRIAPNVFDTSTKQKQIRRAVQSPADHHFLHAETAMRLSDRLLDLDQDFATVAVLGWWPTDVRALVPGKLDQARIVDLSFNRPQAQADLEFLPLRAQSFDLIISNMALHWVNDLPGMLAQIRTALKPNGVFMGSALGGEMGAHRFGSLSPEAHLTSSERQLLKSK